MVKTEKNIIVNAPIEKVFEYINEPTSLPEVWPGMVEAMDIEKLPNGGNKFKWVYKMAGMRFEGTSEDTEFVANQRVVSKTRGGIESTLTWVTEPVDDGTKLTLKAEYIVPVPLLGRLAEAVIIKLNEHELEVLLSNLKARMEI